MIYTELTKKAMRLAYGAHKEQWDKGKIPYIFHPIHLAEEMDTEYECVIALLHDVVEDTSISFKEIEKLFPEEVVSVLKILTHEKGVSYMDYIKEVKKNPIARKIKIADIKHNSDKTRLSQVSQKDILRIEKYKDALKYLEED